MKANKLKTKFGIKSNSVNNETLRIIFLNNKHKKCITQNTIKLNDTNKTTFDKKPDPGPPDLNPKRPLGFKENFDCCVHAFSFTSLSRRKCAQ